MTTFPSFGDYELPSVELEQKTRTPKTMLKPSVRGILTALELDILQKASACAASATTRREALDQVVNANLQAAGFLPLHQLAI